MQNTEKHRVWSLPREYPLGVSMKRMLQARAACFQFNVCWALNCRKANRWRKKKQCQCDLKQNVFFRGI